jgi:hypothetical protein
MDATNAMDWMGRLCEAVLRAAGHGVVSDWPAAVKAAKAADLREGRRLELFLQGHAGGQAGDGEGLAQALETADAKALSQFCVEWMANGGGMGEAPAAASPVLEALMRHGLSPRTRSRSGGPLGGAALWEIAAACLDDAGLALMGPPEKVARWRSVSEELRGASALHLAAISGNGERALRLLPFSDAKLCDARGRTPLMFAARCVNPGLLGAKAWAALIAASDAGARDKDGMSAFDWAASEGESLAVDALWAASPRHDLGPDGRTPLMRAAAEGHWGVVRRLAEDGGDLDEQGADGLSARTLAEMGATVAGRWGGGASPQLERKQRFERMTAVIAALDERQRILESANVAFAQGSPAGEARAAAHGGARRI